MEPEQKARELVEKFKACGYEDPFYHDSIQCALIAVNEILSNLVVALDVSSTAYKFYEQVREEIVKLKG